ncbi:35174_t:CDS:2, partial [Gigaspora margarita]
KKIAELAITNHIEKGKKTSPALSITVALSSKSTNIYITPEIEHVESLNDKLETPKIVKLLDDESGLSIDEPDISSDLPANDELKSSNVEEQIVGDANLCKNPAKGQYCTSHTFKIRKGVIIPQPCKGCGRGTKSSIQLCVPCGQELEYNKEFNESEEVLNLSTNHWIKFNGKLYKKLLHEGYKYTKDLSQYLEEVPLIDIGEY